MSDSEAEPETIVVNQAQDASEEPDFVSLFYGTLTAPRSTFAKISSSLSTPAQNKIWLSALAMIFIATAVPATLKASNAESSMRVLGFFISNLTAWSVLSLTLYYLSFTAGAHKLSGKTAFSIVAWAFLPFIFFAPVACFKGILGGRVSFSGLACLPTIWFLILLWVAFQTALRISKTRMALMAIVVPPVLTLIYFFWVGLAIFSLLSQILAPLRLR